MVFAGFLPLGFLIVITSAQVPLPGDLEDIQTNLEKGGRSVCRYCYGCMFTALCGESCSGSPMCQLCSYRHHCDTTCKNLCTRPNPCENNPCAEDRQCQELTNGGIAYRCICPPGRICQRRRRLTTILSTQSDTTRITNRQTASTDAVTQEATTALDFTTDVETTAIPDTTTAPPVPTVTTTRAPITSPSTRQSYLINRQTTETSASSTANFQARDIPTPKPRPSSTGEPAKSSRRTTSKPYSTTGVPGYWFY